MASIAWYAAQLPRFKCRKPSVLLPQKTESIFDLRLVARSQFRFCMAELSVFLSIPTACQLWITRIKGSEHRDTLMKRLVGFRCTEVLKLSRCFCCEVFIG